MMWACEQYNYYTGFSTKL